MSELETGFRIGDVVAMITRRWPIIVGFAAVGLIAGYLVFSSAPTSYSATARVQVKPITINEFDPGNKSDEVDIATEKELVKSDAVAETVRKALNLSGENRAILSRVVVAVDTTTKSDSMAITFAGDSAEQAQKGANAVAAGYLSARESAAKNTVDSSLSRVNRQIADARQTLTDAQAAVDAAPPQSAQRTQAQVAAQAAQNNLSTLQASASQLNQFDPKTVGVFYRKASLPAATTSKMAMGKGVGVFGLFVLMGLGVAWLIDRRDGLGGGRRRVEQIVPGANIRIMPGAERTQASPAEVDTAIDRLAVELVAGGAPGRPVSALVIGAGMEPPVALAEELASSLAFAGIPALFVLAGSSDRELRHAHSVVSFADLVTSGASIAGPAGLPATAGDASLSAAPTVTWLRPKGSAEAAGLLRRAVVDSLVTRAGRERYEAVIFVAPSPSRTAAGTALGQWVGRTAMIVGPDERPQAEAVATALAEADVRVTEVVWT
ncbi:Wzz/FepE/Etk N-terminal domain-containing protein [Aquihabitans sp. McL0605]|uniref:Wzz/FepE/Etk N-terminal domain-containing protein n=1 Tax=Aquihabitans sp. McL0605 TaxID=3415671 RepID=UPI003CF68C86